MLRHLIACCFLAAAMAAVTREVANDIKQVADSNNRFAADLYNFVGPNRFRPIAIISGPTKSKQETTMAISSEAPGENMFFSPFSVSTCMALVYMMTKGKTANELARVMHYNPDQNQLASSFKKVLDTLDKNTFTWANSLFVEKSFPLREDYLKTTKEGFGAVPENVDFINNSEDARKRINDWAETNTKGKITDFLAPGSVSPSTVMVAASAIHFKALWKTKFHLLDDKRDFKLADGTKKKVDMMSVESSDIGFRYFDEMKAMGVSIPYKTDQKMVLLIPDQPNGLPAVEEALGRMDFVKDVVKKISAGSEVQLIMPKFNMTVGQPLLGPLKKLGLSCLFQTGCADMSGATDSNSGLLALSGVEHKAFIEVNEEGTEAAAVTGAVIVAVSLPLTLVADKPFLYAILSTSPDTVTFLGRYAKPL